MQAKASPTTKSPAKSTAIAKLNASDSSSDNNATVHPVVVQRIETAIVPLNQRLQRRGPHVRALGSQNPVVPLLIQLAGCFRQ